MPALTENDAIAYVETHFANADYEEPVQCSVLYAAPCREAADINNAFDVFFRLSDALGTVYKFTVWVERDSKGEAYVYGEW